VKQFLSFVRKEFYHVFRDKRTLLLLFGLPVVQILIFGYALNSDVKNIGITVLDNAHDVPSQQIMNRIGQSEYFIVREPAADYNDVQSIFKEGRVKCAVVFGPSFGEELYRSGKAQVQIITDASDPNNAKIAFGYLTALIGRYQQEMNVGSAMPYVISTETRMLYNEEQNGSLNFIPGVIALIFMIVCAALTSVSVVREKELGTMEVLLVSPFRPVMVLISKAVPYLLLSLINFVVILTMSYYLLDVVVRGSMLLLLSESILYIITCLSLGLLISNVTTSQQAAMLISMMAMMLPTVLLTGFMFPLENMPLPFQVISHALPSRYYYIIVKAVMLKGLGFGAVWKETLILAGMSVFLLTVALKRFKVRLA